MNACRIFKLFCSQLNIKYITRIYSSCHGELQLSDGRHLLSSMQGQILVITNITTKNGAFGYNSYNAGKMLGFSEVYCKAVICEM